MPIRRGAFAEGRGADAAGVAFVERTARVVKAGLTSSDAISRCDAQVDGWRVVKNSRPFRSLLKPSVRTSLAASPIALGHTRSATQGAVGELANTSPMTTGGLIGCHNGDIDAAALASAFAVRRSIGRTDTEVLLNAVDGARDVNELLGVLTTVVGRAALVWVDRAEPGHVRLARAGLSPLALARDDQGNLFWASNPAWFSHAANRFGARIEEIWRIPEGTLLDIDARNGGEITGHWRFTPTVRLSDVQSARGAIWLGFGAADRKHSGPRWTVCA